jgi:hypothetical protein
LAIPIRMFYIIFWRLLAMPLFFNTYKPHKHFTSSQYKQQNCNAALKNLTYVHPGRSRTRILCSSGGCGDQCATPVGLGILIHMYVLIYFVWQNTKMYVLQKESPLCMYVGNCLSMAEHEK